LRLVREEAHELLHVRPDLKGFSLFALQIEKHPRP